MDFNKAFFTWNITGFSCTEEGAVLFKLIPEAPNLT
jgi:hypothetical protein